MVATLTLVGALAGATAGWWVGTTRSAGFVSTASVVILPLVGNSFSVNSTDSLVSLHTEAQLVRSDRVLESVAASGAGPTDVDILRGKVAVSVAESSEIVLISVRAESADVSEELATTLAASTLDRRLDRAASTRDEQLAVVRSSIERAEAEVAKATDPAIQRVLSQHLVVLRGQRATLQGATLDPGDLIGVRTVRASRRTMKISLVLGGAAFGAAAAFVVARWSSRARVNESRPA